MPDKPVRELVTNTRCLPISCFENHQLSVVYFPELKQYGFGCSVCHILGTTITKDTKVIAIRSARESKGVISTNPVKEGLMLFTHTKATFVCCSKYHHVMAFEFIEGFGFGCVHCKLYTLQVEDRGNLLEIRTIRELDRHDRKFLA